MSVRFFSHISHPSDPEPDVNPVIIPDSTSASAVDSALNLHAARSIPVLVSGALVTVGLSVCLGRLIGVNHV
jgi:hypothetical protein